jgi:peptidoglycan/LPS O-acetylase OafA/YrhL
MNIKRKIYEIQFLRAVATLFVVFFHLFPDKFSGGYIGVDIFFVISGYLMMKIMNEKNQSIIIFYLSRLKRIIPTLTIVIILVCILSVFFFLENISNSTLLSAFSSIFFYSNFFFWITTQNYFAIKDSYLPLSHTWSLSLEFQFYLIVPFIFKFIKKFNRIAIPILLIIIFLSVLFSYNFLGRTQSFYLLP